jgi:hypothetical protein
VQESKAISQIPDAVSLPDAAVQIPSATTPLSTAEISNAAVQLSGPATDTKLPFPFVGAGIPEQFKCNSDYNYWNYMGREKFMDLVNAIKVLESTTWRGY